MTEINWGAFQPVDVGGAFQKGWEQGKARRVENLTGQALNALMMDPNSAGQQIGELAKIAPQNALALVQFQQKQQDRQRDVQFRGAQADYMRTFGPGVTGSAPVPNALAPVRPGMGAMGVGTVGADGGPPIDMAPQPPANWQQNLGPAAVAAFSPPAANGASDGSMPVTPYMGGKPLQPIDPSTDLGAAQQGAPSITAVDPNASVGVDPMAQQVLGGDVAAVAPAATGDTPMPANIARAAQSPNMEARNRAFTEMAKIDPLAAMKIDSEMRDAMLDRLEDADKAYRLAVARLPRVTDDASYQQTLNEVDALLAPLGAKIRDSVPANYPGPEGIRQLHMQALDSQQQLAAMDRRFSAEARADDIEEDNQRADRNTDSIIADRGARTGIARDRASVSAERERRIAAGGGGRGGKRKKAGGGSGSPPSAVNPATGERIVFRGGKWVPAK